MCNIGWCNMSFSRDLVQTSILITTPEMSWPGRICLCHARGTRRRMWQPFRGTILAHKIVRQGYYWPTLHQDTKNYIRKCNRCQRIVPVPRQLTEPLSAIIGAWPFIQSIDLIGPILHGKIQTKFLVVAVNYFTKWTKAEALVSITK